MSEEMTISEAGAVLQQTLMNGWRFRVGKGDIEAVESVTGVSLTWAEPIENVWRFVFSIRRGVDWFKVEKQIDVPEYDEFNIEREDEDDIHTTVQIAGFDMLSDMPREVFPEVKDDIDEEA
jgi:hypothetical protein